jgi:hypothetical protein
MAHFEWTTIQAVKELMKDEVKLFDKYKSWKDKQKKDEEK